MKKIVFVLYWLLYSQILSGQTIFTLSTLPDSLKETSGIANAPMADHYWSHNNKFVNGDPFVLGDLHLFNATNGSIAKTVKINPDDIIDLSDMEDMTEDDRGNLYVGDIGSASTNKTMFRIYKINNINAYEDGETVSSELIDFVYPENKSYNAEGMFWLDNYLYIFTKGFANDTLTISFRVPDVSGSYTAEHLETVISPNFSPAVSSADINATNRTIALLAYQKCVLVKCFEAPYFFTNSEMQIIEFDGPYDVNTHFRSEAVAFTDEFNCIGTHEFKNDPPVTQGVFEFNTEEFVQNNFTCVSSTCGLIENYDFTDGLNNWSGDFFGSASNVNFVPENNAVKITIENGGTAKWQVRLKQEYFNTEIATTYRIAFNAYANFSRDINLLVGQKIDGDYTGYTFQNVALSTNNNNYEFYFTITEPSNSLSRITFDCGGENASNVYINNVCLQPITCSNYVFIEDSVSSAIYKATEILESQGQIKQYADVVFQANQTVQLKESFSVPASATFRVRINACN